MKIRTPKMMDPARLKVIGSSHRKLMKRRVKKRKMGLSLRLGVLTLRT
jgi:hypothetical protein